MTTSARAYITLKDLDRAGARPKGSAFRAFRSLLGELREGTDFVRLDGKRDAAAIAALKTEGRLYASSIHAVLLTEEAAARVRGRLLGADPTPGP